ncbi:MAG: hypothetical protein FJ313_02705 [Gemmatimonadetes bacterium]|nr:hypothetical protein [Gemmatimonadota bacterium]
MDAIRLKETLARGGTVFGCMIVSMGTTRFRAGLQGSGADFVVIDWEHGSRDRKEVQELTGMLRSVDITPIVRVPVPMPVYVAMALDAGAAGVLVPYCEDLDEIRACVAAGKWHPMKGEYRARAVTEGVFPSEKTKTYLQARHRESIVIIGIESEPAYRNLDAILKIDGIDAIFIGPNDMTTSMGIPDEFDNPKYLDLIQDVIRRSEARGKPVLIHQWRVPDSKRAIERGSRFVLHGMDMQFMADGMREQLRQLREAAARVRGGIEVVEGRDTAETI